MRPSRKTYAPTGRVASMGGGLYASVDYLGARGHGGCGLAGHSVLVYEPWLTALAARELAARWLEDATVALKGNSIAALIAAAAAEGGLAVLPSLLGDAQPTLRRAPAPGPVPGCNVWLVTHRDVRRAARVRTVIEHLAGEFSRATDLLRGADAYLPRVRRQRRPPRVFFRGRGGVISRGDRRHSGGAPGVARPRDGRAAPRRSAPGRARRLERSARPPRPHRTKRLPCCVTTLSRSCFACRPLAPAAPPTRPPTRPPPHRPRPLKMSMHTRAR